MLDREKLLAPNEDVDEARYGVMSRLAAPLPDWMRDKSLLPKRPPVRVASNNNGEE